MHVHGYLWVGDKAVFDREGARRPGAEAFGECEVPPMETAHWLRKREDLVRGSWAMPEEAADWLAGQLFLFAPRFLSAEEADAAQLAHRAASAADTLRRGGDVSLGFYLARPLFLSLALVTCSPNRAAPGAPCPVGC
ncbi:hypothetical protein [Streptomyces sp. NPDC008001]|uniref:hypothetical protein n=1 Tax=Streptomyces sp. NPDC008001 TaxID=3364804 RepID=UPI0036EE0A14